MTGGLIQFPPTPFVEIAIGLHQVAFTEAAGLSALEEFVARNPGPWQAEVLANVRATAAMIGELSTTFRRMAPVEHRVRALLADIEVRP